MPTPHGYTESGGITSGGGPHAANDDLFSGRTEMPEEQGGSRSRSMTAVKGSVPSDDANAPSVEYDSGTDVKDEPFDGGKRDTMPRGYTGPSIQTDSGGRPSGGIDSSEGGSTPKDEEGYGYQPTKNVWADGPLVKT